MTPEERLSRKVKGQCTKCEREASETSVLCERHRVMQNEATRKRYKNLNHCSSCKKPKANGVDCQDCRERKRDNAREWRKKIFG